MSGWYCAKTNWFSPGSLPSEPQANRGRYRDRLRHSSPSRHAPAQRRPTTHHGPFTERRLPVRGHPRPSNAARCSHHRHDESTGALRPAAPRIPLNFPGSRRLWNCTCSKRSLKTACIGCTSAPTPAGRCISVRQPPAAAGQKVRTTSTKPSWFMAFLVNLAIPVNRRIIHCHDAPVSLAARRGACTVPNQYPLTVDGPAA